MKRILAVLCVSALASAAPASAQLMGAHELKVAVPLKGLPSTKPVADIFYLVGETGAKETYTLAIKGPASITLFSPGGSEILTAAGTGTVKLEIVLPFTDVFTLAVSRKTPTQAYTLVRKTTRPTLAQAVLASAVGFEGYYQDKRGTDRKVSECWVTPGVKTRRSYEIGLVEEITLSADFETTSFVGRSASGIASGTVTYYFDGARLMSATNWTDGRRTTAEIPADFSSDPESPEIPGSYLCKG
jgi:hypothetical protein